MNRAGPRSSLALCFVLAALPACSPDVSGPNRPPVAVAGPDQQARPDDTVVLDGRASWDPDGDGLSHTWVLLLRPASSAAQLGQVEGSRAELLVDAGGLYVLSLTVNDGRLDSERDVMQVRVDAAECSGPGECDDGDPCTDDRCVSARCTHDALAEGAGCDDGDPCTATDLCNGGVCAGTALDCAYLDDDCNLGACDAASGSCQAAPLDEGTPCDDGLFCTEADACVAGVCAGAQADCSHLDDACNQGVCDENSDSCLVQQLPNQTPCDDGDDCSLGDVCASGVCGGGPMDADGDGFVSQDCGGNDCDDQAAAVNPGVFEGGFGQAPCADGLDNDCDGLTDGDDQTCLACGNDGECEDGNLCNGEETCDNAICLAGTPPLCGDDNPCTDDTCLAASGCNNTPNSAPCDDDLFCTFNDSCQAGSCVGSGSPCQQECLGQCDETLDSCTVDDPGTPCTDDGVHCNGPEQCDGAGACLPLGDPCPNTDCHHCNEADESCFDPPNTPCSDDGAFCNGAELCDDAGLCLSAGDPCPDLDCQSCDEDRDLCADPLGAACADDGVFCNGPEECDGDGQCASAGDPCPGADCQHCNESDGTCFDPPGVACADDGFDCTADECDGNGSCAHPGDHSACETSGSGEICSPACFNSPDGCGVRPQDPILVCAPARLDSQAQGTSVCNLAMDLDGQAACLDCAAEFGHVVLDFSDFGEAEGRCSMDDWRLLRGNVCRDAANAGCAAGGGDRECCDDFSTLCVASMGRFGLLGDEATNCNNREEFRLTKTLDTRGVHALRACVRLLEHGVDSSDAVYLLADNGSDADVVLCQQGSMRGGTDDILETICADLPTWAGEQEALELTLVVHSENWYHAWGIDQVEIKGWSAGCGPDVVLALGEDFEDCMAAQSDWTILGTPTCAQVNDCYDNSSRLEVENDSVTLARVVDASSLDADVELCFQYGDQGAAGGERLSVYFNAGRGWTKVYEILGNPGADNTCAQTCINLSRQSPEVQNNPSLALRFEMVSDNAGAKLRLDQVFLRGARNCDGAAVVVLGALVGLGDGSYDLPVQNTAFVPLTASVACTWDDPALGLGAGDQVDFLPDPAFGAWDYRRKLTLDNSGRPEDLTDFPVPVLLDDSRIDYTAMQNDGRDLMFVAEDGITILPHELERFDKTATSVAWVRVPFIPADSSDAFIWMYYGNPASATSEYPSGVWDASFVGVWHMATADRANGERDSSYPRHNGVYSGGATVRQNGSFGDWAVDFDGSDDFINLERIDVDSGQDDGLTMEVVAFKQAGGDDAARLMSKSNGSNDENHWWMLSLFDPADGAYRLRFRLKPEGVSTEVLQTTGRPLVQDSWIYAVATYDGTTMRIYADGQEVASQTLSGSAPVATDANVYASLAANYLSHYAPFSGLLSEARLSARARSAHWISAQHQAMEDSLANPFVIFEVQEPN